ARAGAEATRASINVLRTTDIDHSIDMEAGPRSARAGDDDVAKGIDRLPMAPGAVGKDDPAVRADAGRHAVARAAERVRGPARPRRGAERRVGAAGELRPAAVAVAAGAGRSVPGRRRAVGRGEPGEIDGRGERMIEMPGAVHLRREGVAGRARDRRGDL